MTLRSRDGNVYAMTERVIYPRFLGVDGSGDLVWELADGRWTWGDDPKSVVNRGRTFEPVRYIEKFGRPIGLGETIDRKAEAELDPAAVLASITPRPTRAKSRTLSVQEGAYQVLRALLGVLDGWIEGARENHDALDHRNESRGEECWTQFHSQDIRRMINDVAREMGLDEFPLPEKGLEDKPQGS